MNMPNLLGIFLGSFKKQKAGPFGAAALQGSGDRRRKEGGAPRRCAYAPCSPVLPFSSQPLRRTARRIVRSSVVRAGAAKLREAASCACGALAAGARARRGAGGELQRLARRREATTVQQQRKRKTRVHQMKLAKTDDIERASKAASQISKRFISKLLTPTPRLEKAAQ